VPHATIVSFPEAETPPHLRAQIRALHEQAWPDSGDGPAHDPALTPVTVALLTGETVVAALDVLSKRLDHDGQQYRASGLSTVVTDQHSRHRGYGTRLVRAAHEVIAASGVDVGLFSCDRPLAGFYAAAGWHVLAGTVLVGGTPEDPLATDAPGFDKVVLGDFFTAHGRRNSRRFVGMRVALYPGPIDRLW
jgi:GNAT superfamily N-acetyltransferase